MSQRIADDFEFIRKRLEELQREKEKKVSTSPSTPQPAATNDLCPCFQPWRTCYGCFG